MECLPHEEGDQLNEVQYHGQEDTKYKKMSREMGAGSG
jgi:hypothetical protein